MLIVIRFFSSPGLKGHVSFCHHLASVVRRPQFTFQSSPLKPLGQFQPNFGGMVLGWSPFRMVSGVLIGHPIWPPLLKIEKRGVVSKKSSPPKPLSQLMPNFGGMVLRWSSFRIISDDPARQPSWPPQRNLV